MPTKRRSKPVKRIPTQKRRDVRREEFDRLVELLNERGEVINELRHDLDIQFKRMAQIQSELDEIRRSVQRTPGQNKI
jgi:hypothetical protein